MSSGEFEQILSRNGNFLSVRRAGGGDGYAALYSSVDGKFIAGIGGGWLPEYSFMQHPKYDCACTPGGHCRRRIHGIGLIRGWRNMLFELASKGNIRVTNEIVRVLGEDDTINAVSKLLAAAPMGNTEPSWTYQSLRLNS